MAQVPTWIETDGSLPGTSAGVIPGPGGLYEIGEAQGYRPGGGTSLFHSFHTFQLGTGDTALFSADPLLETRDIISRVTGGARSDIFGEIRSGVPGANLYLLNPNGFLFGPGSSLDVSGSFHASTAQSLGFAGGEIFEAAPGGSVPLLEVGAPSSFGLIGEGSGQITVQSTSLSAPDALSLRADVVEIQSSDIAANQLVIEGNQILVGEASELSTTGLDSFLHLLGGDVVVRGRLAAHRLETQPGQDGGDIWIRGNSIEIVGPEPIDPDDTGSARVLTDGGAGEPSGWIRLEGGRIVLRDTILSTRGFSSADSGDVTIEAESLLMEGSMIATSGGSPNRAGWIVIDVSEGFELVGGPGLFSSNNDGPAAGIMIRAASVRIAEDARIQASTFGTADAGAITLEVGSLRLETGGFINSSAGLVATGNAGDVTIRASESVEVVGDGDLGVDLLQLLLSGEGSSTAIIALTGGRGNAGSVDIQAPLVSVSDGGAVAAFGAGGLIGTGGDAGSVTVRGNRVEIVDGGLVDSGSIFTGRGGTVSLIAEEEVLVSGSGTAGLPSRVRSFTAGSDPGGDIFISAPTVEISEGGAVSASTLDLGVSILQLLGGKAGDVQIDADVIELSSGGRVESSSFAAGGEGGRIALDAREVIRLTGKDTGVFGQAGSAGPGGELILTAPRISMSDGARLSTTAEPGLGASTPIFGDLFQSGLTLIEGPATGDAGSVTLNAPRISMDDSAIESRSAGAGNAGQIELNVDVLELFSSEITAEADQSFGGSIAINGDRIEVTEDGGLEAIIRDDQQRGFLVRLNRSGISTSVGQGEGNGGNVLVNSEFVVIEGDRAPAVAATAVGGDGGNILLASDFVLAPEADLARFLDASSQSGVDGQVQITSPPTNLIAGIAPLNVAFQDASNTLATPCAARARQSSAFRVTRRRDAPVSPDGLALAFAGQDALPPVGAGPLDQPLRDVETLAQEARHAADSGNAARARTLLGEADRASDVLAENRGKLAVVLHLATTRATLVASSGSTRAADLLAANAALTASANLARQLDSPASESYALGQLGSLYESENRPEEALLLTRRALRLADAADAPELLYRWHWQQARLLWSQGQATAALRSYRRAVAIVQDIRPESQGAMGAPDARFRQTVAPLYTNFVDALLDSSGRVAAPADEQRLLVEARGATEQWKAAELRDYFRDECVAEIAARQTDLDRVSREWGAAVVYPILLPERTELLVSLPSGIERLMLPVGAREVQATVQEFRRSLVDRSSDRYRASARQLHDWLVAPYAGLLEREGLTMLVFVPDGVLRTVPMAALHDGEGFLAERYAVAVTPSLSLVDPKPIDLEAAKMLLAGLSESVQGFSALPKAGTELEAIQDLYGGEVLLDSEFRTVRVEEVIAHDAPSVVHVASHAVFNGDPDSSFVLTHDGRLTMDQLSKLVAPTQFRVRPLELLALSACETAAGDERAALGLAGVAIRAGARSAVGSLWSVQDDATYQLFLAFYQALGEPGVSRAEAMRRAQVSLIEHPLFGHPYYWSPFLVIGSWL
jgi:filamentous hemagglutinin family protein